MIITSTIWNRSWEIIAKGSLGKLREAKTLSVVKKLTKEYCKTMPVKNDNVDKNQLIKIS